MLPVNSISLIRAHELEYGDFAYLLDHANVAAMIGTKNDFTVAVFLNNSHESPGSASTDELNGAVQIIKNTSFLVDHKSVCKYELMETPRGALVIKGDRIFISSTPPSNQGDILIDVGQITDHEQSNIAYGYRDWSIATTVGEKQITLYSTKS